MADRHRNPSLNVRPPAATLTAAQEVIGERSMEMRAFITACLAAVAADPDGFLSHLAKYWPPPEKRGRPPKAAAHAERPASEEGRASDAV